MREGTSNAQGNLNFATVREEILSQKNYYPVTPQAAERKAVERKHDFWSMSGDFFYRHHVAPRGQLFMPSEPSFPTPQKNVAVFRQTKTKIVKSIIDDCENVDGSIIDSL